MTVVEQGVIQQFGGGPLFLELRQSLGALSRHGFLLGGRAGGGRALIRRLRAAVGGRGRGLRRGRRRGDEAVRFAAAFFEDGGRLVLVWLLLLLLHSRGWFDLQSVNAERFNLSVRLSHAGLTLDGEIRHL